LPSATHSQSGLWPDLNDTTGSIGSMGAAAMLQSHGMLFAHPLPA
jgi:hypothetical protein